MLQSPIQIGHEFGRALAALDERRRTIALRRTFARKPEKLAALGEEFGISRERTRQLEANLRWKVESSTRDVVDEGIKWLRAVVGHVADVGEFRKALDELVGDAPRRWRTAAEVAVTNAAGYALMDGVVGDRAFREFVEEVRQRAPRFADRIGVVDEHALRGAVTADAGARWEPAVRNAGLIRIRGSLALRDTRRVRVALALKAAGEPLAREEIARLAALPDNTTLSSLLSSDATFVRLTKDRWGLHTWTDEPYEGVVSEIVKRIERAGGRIEVAALLHDIPERFGVLPATVRNYLATRKFVVVGNFVEVAPRPVAPAQALADARDVVWTARGEPVLRFAAGAHHLRGNSQKISMAVAQHLGVGLDGSAKIPFAHPRGVDAASVIWRSYDPNGPEMGCIREALKATGRRPGEEVHVLLDPAGLRVLDSWPEESPDGKL